MTFETIDDKIYHAKPNYELNGYAILPGVFTQAEMNMLRSESFMCLNTMSKDYLQTVSKSGYRSPALLFWPMNFNSTFMKFRNDERLRKVVQEFLGPDVTQLNNQYYYRLPGDGDEFAWHQDICFRTPKEDYHRVETGYLQTAIIVDPMGEHNGGIKFVSGSHKLGEVPLVPRDNSERGLREYDDKYVAGSITAYSGDLVVWSAMTIHGSRKNESTSHRAYYMNGFARSECVLTEKFPRFLKDGTLQ